MSQLLHFQYSFLLMILEKQWEMAQVLLPSAIHIRHTDEANGFWLHHGSDLAITSTWGVTQKMEDPLCASALFCVIPSNK